MNIYSKLADAWRVSCPIVCLSTSDPAQAITSITQSLTEVKKRQATVFQWDCARGLTVGAQPLFDSAKRKAADIGSEMFLPDQLKLAIAKMDKDSVLVIHNAHRFLKDTDCMQAVWLCRDEFKANRRMLILLGPSIQVPVELKHDVIELDEPLPSVDELQGKIEKITESVSAVKKDQKSKAAGACVGLSAFAAEQLTALNVSETGLDPVGVWADKCRKIDETPGLKVVSSKANFETVAGVPQVKGFLSKILSSEHGPNCIVFVDEIEKSLSGAMGDTSGVSGDQLGVLLQWMQDKRADGMILVGAPGAAKSAIAKACGGESGKPTIQIDLGGMKGSLVGESESRIRDALKVIDSISGGKTLWIATSNNISSLPPELKRRFRFGAWFFDLPTREERQAIWALYTAKYSLPTASDDLLGLEWTGAEIESCCEIAYKTGSTLSEAAQYIVPVSVSGADQLERLRVAADGKFLSASAPGPYRRTEVAAKSVSQQRTIEL